MSVRTFKITELPNGVVFEWTRANRACPEGEWDMPLTLRTSRDDLPGASEPVEHVLGFNFEAQNFQGRWDDRYLGSGVALATLREFEKLVQRGARVRIEFEQQTFEGLITKFTPKYKRADYIKYDFTLSPHSRPVVGVDPPAKPIAERFDLATAVEVAKIRANTMFAEKQKVAVRAPFHPSTTVIDDVGAFVTNIIDHVEAAQQQVEAGIQQPQVALRLAQRFQAIGATARATAFRLHLLNAANALAYQNAIAVLTFEDWQRSTAASSRLMHKESTDAARNIARRARPAGRKVYRPRKGENVYGLSQRFYGTPHEWRRIFDANHLTSPEFAGTERLFIPDL